MTVVWIRLLCSFGFLALLLWLVELDSVWMRLKGADALWIGVSLIAITAATWSMARRWQIAARSFDLNITYARAVREYYLGQMVNIVVPGGVAGDVARAARTRDAADLTRAAQSVLVERIIGQVYILGYMFAGFTLALVAFGEVNWLNLDWLVPLLLATLAAVTWGISRRETATGRLILRVLRLAPQPAMILHGAITTVGLVLGFYASARAIGVVIPPIGLATVIPLVLCAMLIPISVGGWGWREGAAAALFPLLGEPASAGMATGITYGLVLLIAVLPAWLILSAHSFSVTFLSKGRPDTP